MTKRLGRGLESIIEAAPGKSTNFVSVRVDQIRANRFQPRAHFDDGQLDELKASIKKQGVLQPVLVRPIAHGTYELIAGERRWRAAQAVGLQEVPAIVKRLEDQEALEYSLIENIQRSDLNPLEEASAFRRLTEDFGYTQEQIAAGLGKDRTTISNSLRLLKLPEPAQNALRQGRISMGHARALLAVEGSAKQEALLNQVVRSGLSVRQLEGMIQLAQPAKRRKMQAHDPLTRAVEEKLRQALGTKVSVKSRRKGGRILIEYYSSEDLTRLMEALGVRPE